MFVLFFYLFAFSENLCLSCGHGQTERTGIYVFEKYLNTNENKSSFTMVSQSK